MPLESLETVFPPFLILLHLSTKSRILWGHEKCWHPYISGYVWDRISKLCKHDPIIERNWYKPFSARVPHQLKRKHSFSSRFQFFSPTSYNPKENIWSDEMDWATDLNLVKVSYNIDTNRFRSLEMKFGDFQNFRLWRHQSFVTSSKGVGRIGNGLPMLRRRLWLVNKIKIGQ